MTEEELEDSSDDDDGEKMALDGYSEFQIAIVKGTVSDIKNMIKADVNLAQETVNHHNIVQLAGKRSDKNRMIKQIIICEYEKMKYLRDLLELDLRLIKEIAQRFDRIMMLFQNKIFLNKTRISSTHHEDFFHYCFDLETNKNVEEYEFELIIHFRQISQCIRLLNRHDKGLKDQYNGLINWCILEGIEEALRLSPLWNTDIWKLFESISSDCLRLHNFFSKVNESFTRFDMKCGNIRNITFNFPKCNYPVLNEMVSIMYNNHLGERSREILDIVEQLNLNEVNAQFTMFHCLQFLGEISLSFSNSMLTKLRPFYFSRLKNIRNEIKNHWENTIRATYLLGNVKAKTYEEHLVNLQKVLIEFYRPLLYGIMNNQDISSLFSEQSRKKMNEVTSSFKKLLEKIPLTSKDPNSTEITYIVKQIELLRQCIQYIRDILQECKQTSSDESIIRSRLQMPQVHYRCLFFLTIIGSTVQNMRTKHVFLTTIPFSLHEELDYLRWIRNSLMHYDIHFRSNFYRNTLFDYLSNDLLLEEYSVDSHGHLLFQFEGFFKDLELKLDCYCEKLSKYSLDNYFEQYFNNDRVFYENDIERKKKRVDDFFPIPKNTFEYLYNIKSAETLAELIEQKNRIENCCATLNLEIIGIFGPLTKCGPLRSDSPSGILVKTNGNNHGDSTYENLLKLKRYVNNVCRSKNLCIVEEGQMREYIDYKYGRNMDISFLLVKISRYSLERLVNGQQLYSEIETCIVIKKVDKESKETIDKLFEKENAICYEYRDNYRNDPILHMLCDTIIDKKLYSPSMRNYFKLIIKRMLDAGADINVQTHNACTIIHNLADTLGHRRRSLRSCIPKGYYKNLNLNIVSRWSESIGLSMALINNIYPLKYELRQLRDLYQHANELIIAAINTHDLEFLQYMLREVRDERGECLTFTGRYQRNGHCLFFELLEQELKNDTKYIDRNIVCLFMKDANTYTDLIQFLLENNVELRCENGSFEDYEKLLMHLLKYEFHELASSLIRREKYVDFGNSQGIYPIHVALENLIKCKIQTERENHLKIIKLIIQHSENLNQELRGGHAVPLYIAAKHGQLDVVKMLLEEKHKVNINYKPHRYSHNMCHNAPQNEYEIIILLLENGLPTEVWKTFDFIKNDRLRSYLERCEKMFDGYRKNKNDIRNDIYKVLREEPDLSRLLINRRDEFGKNLSYYAIEKEDVEFIKLILEYERSSVNFETEYTLVPYCKIQTREAHRLYIEHVSSYATGEMMTLFLENDSIDWRNFNNVNMQIITERAIERNDQVLFQLIEQYVYPIISYQFIKHSLVKSYAKAFRNLESPANRDNRRSIEQLPNRQVLLQNKCKSNYSTLLSIAVRKSKLSIIKYLIDDCNYEIHTDSCSSICNDKISALDDFIASRNNDLKMLRYLTDQHVRILATKSFNQISLLSDDVRNLFRTYIDNNEDIREFLFESVAKHSHLHDINFVQFLLSLNTWDPNQCDDVGYAPLHHCAEKFYNDTIGLLCDSKRVDVELLTQNLIFSWTTGQRTPVGMALEAKNFEGARLLIEKYNASPYEYLLVLLIDALSNHDAAYVKSLLGKSIITDFEHTTFFVGDYSIRDLTEINNIITFPRLERALIYATENNELLEIPHFILNELNKCCKIYTPIDAGVD